MHVGIVGLGAMGEALARALHQGAMGQPRGGALRLVALSSRRTHSARALADELGGVAAVPFAALTAHAELVLLAVGDQELAHTVHQGAWGAEHVVVHLSGAQTLAPLAHAQEAGARVGSLHPMVSVPRRATSLAAPPHPSPFTGAIAALDGAPSVLPTLEALAQALDMRHIVMPDAFRARWHAAATLVGNASTALVAAAEALLTEVPADAYLQRQALAGLLASVARNLRDLPPDATVSSILTGPIARGDVDTVARHLAHLPQSSRAAYHHAASLVLLAAADRLPASARDAIAALLPTAPAE